MILIFFLKLICANNNNFLSLYDIHYDHIVAVICNYAEHVLTFSRTPAGNSAYSQLYHIQRDALHTYRVRMICIYIYIYIIYCTTVRTYIIYHTSTVRVSCIIPQQRQPQLVQRARRMVFLRSTMFRKIMFG
jgi:hypothetical protein